MVLHALLQAINRNSESGFTDMTSRWKSNDNRGDKAIRRRAVAKLAVVVRPPTVDVTRSDECTGELETGAKFDDVREHAGAAWGDNRDGCEMLSRGALADLPVGIIPPASSRVVREKRAGMVEAEGQLRHIREAHDWNWIETVVGISTIAELSLAVPAPALRCRIAEDGARTRSTTNRHCYGAALHICRRESGVVDGRPIA